MAYAEQRGNLWRARWRGPDGKLDGKAGFRTKKAAEEYGRDQEAAIRGNTYVDPQAGQMTLTEWVNLWFPALDLEPSTLSNYRYAIEVHILPKFGGWTLASLEEAAQEIALWEMSIVRSGLSRRTAGDARTVFTSVLSDAIPRYLKRNPAARKRGKGRRGQRRIARIEKQEKAWPSPLQALLVAERAAILTGSNTGFVLPMTIAYTGMRWSEAMGLPPGCVKKNALDIHWKLYELRGRFYRGRPKDGSMRTADLPPFLSELLQTFMNETGKRTCRCVERDNDARDEIEWCHGRPYVFLGPDHGHLHRSNYSERVMRPAADGWYPQRKGGRPRSRMPVLVDLAPGWPGSPLAPWPVNVPEEPAYEPPRIRGRRRVPEDAVLASWLPLLTGLTPHGLRHGHKTWMDEAKIPRALSTDRMGHDVPGMEGVYGHISPAMRAELVGVLQTLWDEALDARAAISSRSPVPLLDALLAARTVARGAA